MQLFIRLRSLVVETLLKFGVRLEEFLKFGIAETSQEFEHPLLSVRDLLPRDVVEIAQSSSTSTTSASTIVSCSICRRKIAAVVPDVSF